MKIYGKAADQIEKLVDQFKTGNVADSVAKVLIKCDDMPSSKWSTMNRWISFVQTGDADCRGFKQWESVDRKVKKGEKAAYILRPNIAKKKTTDEAGNEKKETFLTGFGSVPVFGLSQTEGKPVDYEIGPSNPPNLIEVANSFGIPVNYGLGGGCYGAYSPDKKTILLCTHAEQTFFHELSHAAHHKILGSLKGGQHPKQEIVAEFCACVLARIYGKKSANEGYTYKYVEAYANQIKKSVPDSILSFMGDIIKVLDLIIDTKEKKLAIAA